MTTTPPLCDIELLSKALYGFHNIPSLVLSKGFENPGYPMSTVATGSSFSSRCERQSKLIIGPYVLYVCMYICT
jgi:hypothetical protein